MYFALFVLPLLKEVKSEQNDLLCFILYLTTFDLLLYHCCLALTSTTVDPPVNSYILYNLAGVPVSLFAKPELGCELCTALVELPPFLFTPWSTVLEKLTGFCLVKKFPTFYRTRTFITAFTNASHLSLSWASLIQSIPPHPTSWRSILILSFLLCIGLQSDLFPSGFPTKTLYMPLFSPICTTCPTHLIFHPNNIGWGVQINKVLIM